VISLVQAHPVLSGSAALLVTAGGTFGGIKWKRRRDLEAQQLAYVQFAQSQEIARYHGMGPAEFEHALAFLCARDGCTHAQVVGRAGDLGADVIAFAPDGRKIVLQAKRYGPTTKVGGPDLQRFGGTCFNVHRAGVAAVVTTSTFTKQASEFATHMGIRLVDAHALAAWASRTGPAPWH
jgi:restriction system protein